MGETFVSNVTTHNTIGTFLHLILRIPTEKSEQKPLATLLSHKDFDETIRNEMEKHKAKVIIRRALNHTIPKSAKRSYEQGDKFLVWL